MSADTPALHLTRPCLDELSAPSWEGSRNSSLLLLDAALGRV